MLTKEEAYKRFFELKAEEIMYKVWLSKNRQPAYMGSQVNKLFDALKIEDCLNQVSDELDKLIIENIQYFKSVEEIKAVANNYLVSLERQKELTKKRIGRSMTIDKIVVD